MLIICLARCSCWWCIDWYGIRTIWPPPRGSAQRAANERERKSSRLNPNFRRVTSAECKCNEIPEPRRQTLGTNRGRKRGDNKTMELIIHETFQITEWWARTANRRNVIFSCRVLSERATLFETQFAGARGLRLRLGFRWSRISRSAKSLGS